MERINKVDKSIGFILRGCMRKAEADTIPDSESRNAGKRDRWITILTKVVEKYKYLIIGLVILYPFLSLFVMRLIAMLPGDILAVPSRVSDWFGYSASYSGTVVSVLVGLLTIYLTLVLDRISKDEQKNQHRYSVATNMPDLICEECILYHSNRDIPYKYLDKLPYMPEYILELHMIPAFPIYFSICVKGVRFKWNHSYGEDHILKTRGIEEFIGLEKKDYYFINNKNFELAIFLNIHEESKKLFQALYESYLYPSDDYRYKENLIDVTIQMECKNDLLPHSEDMGVVPFELNLVIENKGRQKDREGIAFQVLERKIKSAV